VGDSRLIDSRVEARDLKERSNERIRILANWDPSYPDEKVRWYDEYIARNAPISTNWLQQPCRRESPQHEYLEIRGMGLYTEQGESESTLVVAPLDDGSICIWDIAGTKGRKGSIISRSKSGILFPNELSTNSPPNSHLISTGVTECVSVDSARKIAYVAVQNGKWEALEHDLKSHGKYWIRFTLFQSCQRIGTTIKVNGTLNHESFHVSLVLFAFLACLAS
jgi:hypothetical protein